MSDPKNLHFHPDFDPSVVPIKADEIKFPIELRNHNGDVIASICRHYRNPQRFLGFVNHHTIEPMFGKEGFETITECITEVFGYLYREMQAYRMLAEEYSEVRKALRKAIK